MTVIRTSSSDQIQPLRRRNIVLAIGAFDGVHIGHRALINRTKQLSIALSAECAIYTFRPYPHHVYDPKIKPLIFPLARKYEILEELGVQYIVEQNFTCSFSKLHSEEFVQYLFKQIPLLRGICVGADFRFGHSRAGDTAALAALCIKYGIHCEIVDNVVKDGTKVSSTCIRQLIATGNLKEVQILLGEKFP